MISQDKFQISVQQNILCLLSVMIFLYIFLCLLFPAADLDLNKKVVFFITILFSLYIYLSGSFSQIDKNILIRAVIVLGIPIIYSPLALINTSSDSEILFLVISCTGILLVFAINLVDERLFFKSFLFSSLCLAICTIVLAVSSDVSLDLAEKLEMIFLDFNSGILGERDFNGIKFTMVHFRTAPILIIPFSYYFIKVCDGEKIISNFILSIVFFLAIYFTASRGIMVFSFLSLFFICILNLDKIQYRIVFLILFLGGLAVTAFFVQNTNFFSKSETSNMIKLGHFTSFLSLIRSDPLILLTGQGTGSQYYSTGFECYTFQTELTFLDMIRYWGIFGTLIFLSSIILPNTYRLRLCYAIPFIMYFFNATTNPLYFNSTGMLIVVLYWYSSNRCFNEHY